MVDSRTVAAILMVAAAGACTDPAVVEPALSPDAASRAELTLPDAPPAARRYLVVFPRSAPAGFESAVTRLGGRVLVSHAIGVALVEGLDPASAAVLERRAGARYVVEDADFRLPEPSALALRAAPRPVAAGADVAAPTSGSDPTAAIHFALQWNMTQIHADDAWGAGRLGSADVTVAILDTGIDYLVPDLVGRVDLSRSASFVPQDDYFTSVYWPGRDPTTDLHFHGTNVATQVVSNAWAWAGVTSRTTLMSVKVCGVLGPCPGVFEGILFAIDHGADVINLSLGAGFPRSAYPGITSAYDRLMNYARQKGVTVVVAAGNDADDLDRHRNIKVGEAEDGSDIRAHVPSFFALYCDATQVICVAATRRDDVPAHYTNYGRSAIDVAAPGGDLVGAGDPGDWVYSLCPHTSLVFPCFDPAHPNAYFSIGVYGTSQAAPHVAGLAALVVEDLGRAPARVKARILQSADDVVAGVTPYYGKGRINVARAVGAM